MKEKNFSLLKEKNFCLNPQSKKEKQQRKAEIFILFIVVFHRTARNRLRRTSSAQRCGGRSTKSIPGGQK
jgi:hypothetical protein